MEYVFLFSGQGAQFKGMAEDLCRTYPAARAVVDDISFLTGEDIAAFLWETENIDLSRSDKSQLAITAAETAILAVLDEKGIKPSAVAGFSLGEFPALYAAGVLDFASMVRIVQKRGRIMQRVCETITAGKCISSSDIGGIDESKPACGMAAVIKLTPEKITELLSPYSDFEKGIVFAANMNSPVQTVVSGTAEGLDIAEKLCKEAGAKRFIRLAVAGPFHSPLMAEAAKEFETVLDGFTFADPKIPVFSNVTGKRIRDGAEAKKNAVLHITHPVLWTSEEKELETFMHRESAWQLLEVGPGTTLCNLWRDSGCSVPAALQVVPGMQPAGFSAEESLSCLPTGTLEQLEKVIGLSREILQNSSTKEAVARLRFAAYT